VGEAKVQLGLPAGLEMSRFVSLMSRVGDAASRRRLWAAGRRPQDAAASGTWMSCGFPVHDFTQTAAPTNSMTM
jgi:hypothetical protein